MLFPEQTEEPIWCHFVWLCSLTQWKPGTRSEEPTIHLSVMLPSARSWVSWNVLLPVIPKLRWGPTYLTSFLQSMTTQKLCPEFYGVRWSNQRRWRPFTAVTKVLRNGTLCNSCGLLRYIPSFSSTTSYQQESEVAFMCIFSETNQFHKREQMTVPT